jgi:trigger factor
MSPTAVNTRVTELPESRVRVEAEIPADEVERRVNQAARALGRDLKIPGFRKGKVPAPVVISRVGRAAILDEAVRSTLGRWYTDAIDAAGITPVGDPELKIGDLPAEGEPLTFSIEIGVRPPARLGEWRGLEVGRREPAVAEEAVEQSIEELRERLARLETREGPAERGDFVVMDYEGSIDGEPIGEGTGRDQLVEIGSGRVIPGLEDGLQGAVAGEEREIDLTFPDDYGQTELAGRPATFAVTVKEVKRKELPDIDDEFASDAAGFDTLDELREDIRSRLLEADRESIEDEFREAALDAAVEVSQVDVPDKLVEGRARELWERTLHALSHRGISKDVYLKIAGKTEDELLAEARPDAEQTLKREAVVAAIVEAEGIDPSDDAVAEALAPAAEREGVPPDEVIGRLRDTGRLDDLRRDLAAREAMDAIVAAATPISVEKARAREKLWTPGGKDAAPKGGSPQGAPGGASGGLWTPRS